MSKRKLSNTTQNLFDSFIQECRLYQKSESTISNYEISFNVLCKHFDGIEKRPIGSIGKSLIVEFTKKLSDTSLSVASINHYLRDIRAFLYWCMEDEYIPPFKVKCIKDTTPKKMPYTKEEAKVMLRKPSINDGFAEWRSWGVINMVMGCGVRAMTIVNMLKEDMDFANNTIYLRHSKDGGQNVITLVPQLKRAIVTYLKHNIFNTEFLFPSITGARMTVNGLRQSIASYNRSRGVQQTSIHLLRHTFGAMWAENGGDVYQLQRIMTHKDIRTTLTCPPILVPVRELVEI